MAKFSESFGTSPVEKLLRRPTQIRSSRARAPVWARWISNSYYSWQKWNSCTVPPWFLKGKLGDDITRWTISRKTFSFLTAKTNLCNSQFVLTSSAIAAVLGHICLWISSSHHKSSASLYKSFSSHRLRDFAVNCSDTQTDKQASGMAFFISATPNDCHTDVATSAGDATTNPDLSRYATYLPTKLEGTEKTFRFQICPLMASSNWCASMYAYMLWY